MEAGPTAFPGLNSVLRELTHRVRAVLGPVFTGAYLQGSFALGDGDACSDADFVIVTRRDLDPGEVPALDAMHKTVHDLPDEWAQHLEGSYVPEAVVRARPPAPYPLLFLNNGDRTLGRSVHDDSDVVRWILRERGLVLEGPDPRELVDPVRPDALRAEVWRTMEDFGREILVDGLTLDVLWRQGFTVLFYCRALMALACGGVPSKPVALRWALHALEPRWAPLIRRSFEQRARYPRGRGAPEAHSKLTPETGDAALTREFVRYALGVGTATIGGPWPTS